MYEHMHCGIFRQLRYCYSSFKIVLINKYDCGNCVYWRCMCVCVCRFLLSRYQKYQIISPKVVSSNPTTRLNNSILLLLRGQSSPETLFVLQQLFCSRRLACLWLLSVYSKFMLNSQCHIHISLHSHWSGHLFHSVMPYLTVFYIALGGADNSVARPTSRCLRTEWTVSLERGVSTCADLQILVSQRLEGSMSSDSRDFNNIEPQAVIKFFIMQDKARKEITPFWQKH
jgi:hypothetical protein